VSFNLDILVGSDPKIVCAFWVGVAVSAMTLITLAVIIIRRQVNVHRDRVHAKAIAFWKAIIVATPAANIETIPRLLNRDMSGFLEVWNDVHEALRGATTTHLVRIAHQLRLQKRLYKRLALGGFHARLMAIIALGHVKNKESFDRIEKFIDDKNPMISLCAARGLMQIDAGRAISKFVPHIVSRSDWSQGSVATILDEAGAEKVTRELCEATLQAEVDIAPRLIRFLASVSPESAAPIIRKTLLASLDEQLISTCLQVMTTSKDLDCVRPLLTHTRWHVRMQAAVTLGRLGIPGDEDRLVTMLSDAQWWVRYRAAQALMKLGFVKTSGMHRILESQTDVFARDIIKHVMAEEAMGKGAVTEEAMIKRVVTHRTVEAAA
jgi:HEAT repeat protein